MKDARPQKSETSAKSNANNIPPRLTGQAVQMPLNFAFVEEMPESLRPKCSKLHPKKRTLMVLWPDGAMGTGKVPAAIGRLGLPFVMMVYDLAPLYKVARAALERDWREGLVC